MSDMTPAEVIAEEIERTAKDHPLPVGHMPGAVAPSQFYGIPIPEMADVVLAALRAEGYELYRPDDCEQVDAVDSGPYGSLPLVQLEPGPYLLVPVEDTDV